MVVLVLALAMSAAGVVATLVTLPRDGYGPLPTRARDLEQPVGSTGPV